MPIFNNVGFSRYRYEWHIRELLLASKQKIIRVLAFQKIIRVLALLIYTR